jgi:sphingomyelin phosphodiesterase 2
MSIVREHGLLTDAWSTSHEHGFLPDPENGEIDSPEEAIEEYGVTADSPLNSYTAGKTLESVAARWKGKRLDYILYRGPARFHRRRRRRGEQNPANGLLTNGRIHEDVEDIPVLHCTSSQVAMMGKVPEHNVSLSDHFGIEATLIIQYSSPRQVSPPPAAPTVWDTVATSPSAPPATSSLAHRRPYVDADLSPDSHSPPVHVHALANVTDDIGAGDAFDIGISQVTVEAMLQAIGGAYRAARSRSQKELFIFGVCVVLVVAIAIGSSWQPVAALNSVFVFVGAAFTWLGTTMLYAGFIWGNWELNWLTTVVEELELLNRGRITVAGR